MPNPNRKSAVGNGPYHVTLSLDFQDTNAFALFARRQYRTLRQATDALPGVKLRKRRDGYAVIFGDRQIGTLSKATPAAPVIHRSTPRKSNALRHAYQAVAVAVVAIIAKFF
ncbi:MAG TPA: hypothetical protein PLD20_00855 [Blastocatellia bacterium]|nr:hypothetical protein [Blastocatellia bacterium]HMV81796.1 hypothetical protein [Blastocatellia bacterium]HMX24023.1 hypothetical protein [Blastocatellia bacterium]HMY70695.1 hypothetical protein [Blastocatellia bacterium]HMZ16484.1 hypothetical protein [Blastocatellia bacterium]